MPDWPCSLPDVEAVGAGARQDAGGLDAVSAPAGRALFPVGHLSHGERPPEPRFAPEGCLELREGRPFLCTGGPSPQ